MNNESSIIDEAAGLDVVIRVAEKSVSRGYCKETSLKLVQMFNDKWQRADIEVELAVTCLYGKIFAETTYLLEGDQPLWSQVYDVMSKLAQFLSRGPTVEQWQPVKDAATRSSQLVQELFNARQQSFVESEEQVRSATSRLTRISSAYERATDRIRNQTGVVESINTPDGHQATEAMRTVRRARQRRPTGRANNYNNERITQARVNANRLKNQRDEAMKELDDAKKTLKKIEKEISQHPRVTTADFEDHAKCCVQKSIVYFRQKFIDDDAPLKELMDLFDAARVCDPTVLIHMDEDDAKENLITLSNIIERVSSDTLQAELKGILYCLCHH